jgi:hypothetical protein
MNASLALRRFANFSQPAIERKALLFAMAVTLFSLPRPSEACSGPGGMAAIRRAERFAFVAALLTLAQVAYVARFAQRGTAEWASIFTSVR